MQLGSNTPRLETERLILRRFVLSDAEDLFRILSDEEVNRFLPWFAHRSVAETRAWLAEDVFPDYRKPVAYRYALERKGENRVVGYLSLLGVDAAERCGEVGYGLLRESWGQGLMTEACLALFAQLRRDGFRYATATHDAENPASGRVMQKCGMRYVRSYPERWQPKDKDVVFRLYRIDWEG